MTERNLRAYYYSFTATGVDAVNAILEAVARAGAGYHNTEDWDEPTIERIQQAADEAAKKWDALREGGYCKEYDRCVCGGDTPEVRAGCANWINPEGRK